MYSQKTIQDLKPDWYLQMSKSEKLKEQERLKQERTEMWNEKPKSLACGVKLVAKYTRKSITQGKTYKVMGYFATLVTTIYYSQWHEFVTLKNDDGWTVKMNLNNFDVSVS
jgi:hypothetical protein